METTHYFVHTTKGYKPVLIGPKGGKYIQIDGKYVSLKKLPEYLILLEKKAPAAPQQQPPLSKYQARATKVVTHLKAIKPKVHEVVKNRGFFTGHEYMIDHLPDKLTPEVLEAINVGLAAVVEPDDPNNKVTNIDFSNVNTESKMIEYIKYQTYNLYKDVF